MHSISSSPVEQALLALPLWQHDPQTPAISRKFVFSDFEQAFGFLQSIAVRAQQLDHHPEWRNVYNIVEIRWTSHDIGGLTERDFVMAQFCDALFISSYGGRHAKP